jgi:hypothetical protein
LCNQIGIQNVSKKEDKNLLKLIKFGKKEQKTCLEGYGNYVVPFNEFDQKCQVYVALIVFYKKIMLVIFQFKLLTTLS